MYPYGHVIFDLDGTLTDSQEGIVNSVRYALESMGVRGESRERLLRFIGPPLRDSFSRFYGFSTAGAEEAVSAYRRYYTATGIYENRLYGGIDCLVAGLARQGRRMYLATTKPLVYAKRILGHFSLARHFTGCAGSNLDGTLSRKGELIGDLLARYPSIEREGCVMVGDRHFDIEGAREHGIAAIGVTYGYGSPGEISSAAPDGVAGSVGELAELLGAVI